jgi:tetratricopeptide (TPR) repeat protein
MLKVIILFLTCVCIIAGCGQHAPVYEIEPAKQRDFANALVNEELYAQAIKEYKTYLKVARLSNTEKAKINYIIANLYMDRLHDYEEALAHYLRILHVYGAGELENEVNRRRIECLERLGRALDAQHHLEQITALEKSSVSEVKKGEPLAKIGNRIITEEELKANIPPYMQDSILKDKDKKLEFLKQYIASELMYDTAKRKGYDRDKEILRQVHEIKKNMMIQKLIQEEIKDETKINTVDMKLYYQAHKDKYKDKEGNQLPFEIVKGKVEQDMRKEREQIAYQKLMQRMLEAEEVKIFIQ